MGHGEKTVKQTAKSTGKATVKMAKGSVKTAQKSIKTAEHTARATIKTTQQAAKTAQKTAQTTAKANWPKHEIFQLRQDTKSYYGCLDGLVPNYSEADIRQSVKIASANLYHAVCHGYLFGDESTRVSDLKPLHKSVFFILQLAENLRSGEYHRTKAELLRHLTGEEKSLLEIGMNWDRYENDIALRSAVYYEKLTGWCKSILCGR